MKMLAFLASLVFAAGFIKAADISPVLLYLNDRVNTQTVSVIGQTVSSNNFLNTIKNGISGSSADVIIVDNLKDEDIRFLFKKTSELKDNVVYEPSVQSPYQTLIQYLDENQIKVNEHQVNDVNEALTLFIQKKENNQASSVFLVGRENHHINLRRKRDSSSVQNITIFGSNCAAFFASISITDNTVSGQSVSFSLPVDTSGSGPTIECKDMTSNGTVTMKFINNNYYWQLSNASISTNKAAYSLIYMGSPYGMETPYTFSFACTRTVFQLQNPNITTLPYIKINLYVMDFQLQPFNVSVNATSNVYTFGNVNYCQGFFTSGIWMAITASLILTLILAFGVSFLFGINTMDRFDDPKGKPLSIALEK